MSSRQEQKERRRHEREERERAEANAQKRKQLAQITGGVVIVAAIVIGIVLAASGGGPGGKTGDASDKAAPATLPIPPQRITSLPAAVKAAGCAFREFKEEGSTHVDDALTSKDFKTNPPTSGNHNPIPADDGYYAPGGEPDVKNSVHTLEHGRIELQYTPKLPLRQQRRLRTLFNEPVAGGPERYHLLMFRNQSGMKYAVAAVAWTRSVVCKTVNDKTFDALRTFRDQFVDQGPEQVP